MYNLQAYEDIRSVEAAFGDLHRRYEKTKQTLDGYKKVSVVYECLTGSCSKEYSKHLVKQVLLQEHKQDQINE